MLESETWNLQPRRLTVMHREIVLILDFGSQYTRLITRSIREAGVYSQILPFNNPWEEIESLNPKGIVLSGGP